MRHKRLWRVRTWLQKLKPFPRQFRHPFFSVGINLSIGDERQYFTIDIALKVYEKIRTDLSCRSQ